MNNKTLNEKISDTATFLAIALIVISWATPQEYFSTGSANMILGSILVGMNLVRYYQGIAMGKASFLIGAFLFNMGFLEGATLYNPMVFPLFGLMVASFAVYEALAKRQDA